MPCVSIKDGIICTFTEQVVDLRPYGAHIWMEWHSYLGPCFFRSENRITPIWKPSKKTWDAFNKWKEEQNV